MRTIKNLTFILFLGFSIATTAQETDKAEEKVFDKESYYKTRALEDAKYEQQFKAETKAEEETFWDDQKAYEEDLKRKDKRAYKAYMRGKKDAYKSHYAHCDNHCHHSDHYYHHASFYYYRYDGYYYDRYPSRRNSINVRTRVSTPRVSLGLF